MAKKSVEAEILKLREEIHHHNYLYYMEGLPKISDQEFDRLLDKLQALEDKHPEFNDPNSPTQRVGGTVLSTFDTVTHTVPMLSIDKSYDAKDIKKWLDRISKKLPGQDFQFYVDPKIDGVAVGLRYESGQLVQGVTRGDGAKGDDITHNVRTIKHIPLKLEGEDIPEVLEVRGEIYMTRDVFDTINAALEKAGADLYKNPRNLTAGTLKSLDSKTVAERKLSFQMHGVGEMKGEGSERHSDFVKRAKVFGLPSSEHSQLCTSIKDVMKYLESFEKLRRTLSYDTDGVVIRVDSFERQKKLGTTSKAPRWAVAYKYAAEQVETIIESVDFQLGKNGAITPCANMKAVDVAGTTVKRATLHNFDEIKRKDIRLGDQVIIEKAGEIIPYVVESLKDRRTGKETVIEPPSKCPICDAETARKDGEAVLRCTNPRCPGRIKAALRHFASRKAMDIDGLGEKWIDIFVEKGMVGNFDDLYTLTAEQLEKLDRMGKRSAAKLVKAIEASKSAGMARLLNALCLPLVGESGGKLLSKHYTSIDALEKASTEKLSEIDGIGDVMAEEIVAWFEHPENQRVLTALKDHGVSVEVVQSAAVVTKEGEGSVNDAALKGLAVCVTGKLVKRSRDEIHALIEAAGGKVSKSVSSKTNILVAGEKAGSKLAKAQKLGVEVISEDDFYKRVGVAGSGDEAAEEAEAKAESGDDAESQGSLF